MTIIRKQIFFLFATVTLAIDLEHYHPIGRFG